jgi:hypothetical protein
MLDVMLAQHLHLLADHGKRGVSAVEAFVSELVGVGECPDGLFMLSKRSDAFAADGAAQFSARSSRECLPDGLQNDGLPEGLQTLTQGNRQSAPNENSRDATRRAQILSRER